MTKKQIQLILTLIETRIAFCSEGTAAHRQEYFSEKKTLEATKSAFTKLVLLMEEISIMWSANDRRN